MRRAPARRWKAVRDEIHATILAKGFDTERGTFVQAFGEPGLDAALLRLASYGFLAYDDQRMVQTVAAIREALESDGLLRPEQVDPATGGPLGNFPLVLTHLSHIHAALALEAVN
jgi:GH15 family glucan-1,4-alpha-glucosidase